MDAVGAMYDRLGINDRDAVKVIFATSEHTASTVWAVVSSIQQISITLEPALLAGIAALAGIV